MKQIGVYNIGSDLLKEMEQKLKIVPSNFSTIPDAFYIEWYPPEHGIEDEKFIHQLTTLKYVCVKLKIPVIIFDRFLSIKSDMKKWLRKYKIKILEPSLIHGKKTEFLPPYINTKLDLGFFPKREINLGIIDDDILNKIGSFENYYLKYSSLNPSLNIRYNGIIPNYKKEEYNSKNLIYDKELSWRNIIFTIAISRSTYYKNGIFDSYIINALNNGCIPLLPYEHRFYHALFKNFVIYKESDISFYVKSMKNISEVLIYDIFKNIEKYFPEFTVENVCDRIIKMFRGMI